MSNKGYVIVEIGFEYNDEVYHSSYNDPVSGRPIKFFTDEATAMEKCAELNFKDVSAMLKSGEIGSYGYSMDEIYGSNAIIFMCDVLHSLGETSLAEMVEHNEESYDDPYTEEGFNKLTSDQQLQFVELMVTKFYTVHVVEVE